MLRLPAVAGRFYPNNPAELTSAVREYAKPQPLLEPAKACLVPHAGYRYSGPVAGAVFSRIALPTKIIILGVRHFPRGESIATISNGAWRTPVGDAPIDETLASALHKECPLLREDRVAHSTEHSIEVQLPFLQMLSPGFAFVPIALGAVPYDDLVAVGEALARVLAANPEVLLLTTSDLNHYENDATTRVKDKKAIDQILAFNPRGLYDLCASENISMCGLGPAVAMLTALRALHAKQARLVRYATSADVSGDTSSVVGYAGLIFS
ncbi:MAG TPA: AmmeMemoRadiSam system protein B [Candidatus Saccharimonadales bacterium]|nr:AmmeMemoRadiSam system protein B [Candidatus Saccharimonadales bacterium]